MTRLTRLLLMGLITLVIGVTGYFFPNLIDNIFIKSLTSIFFATTLLLGWFFRQLHTVKGIEVLRAREMERYALKKVEIRDKFWKISFISLAASGGLWISSIFASQYGCKIWFPFLVGFLSSFAVVNALIVKHWLNELSAFSDQLQLLEMERKEHSEEVKKLSPS